MSTDAAFSTDTPPQTSVPSGDEFSAEELAILKGETPPEAVPPSPVPNDPAPVADNDDDGLEEIETEDPDQPRDDKGRFVPKSAYLRVKEESRTKDQKLAQVAAELIRQRERDAVMRELLASANPQQQQPEPEREIAPEEDIFGAYKQLAAKLQKMQQDLGERDTQTRSQIQAMALQAEATRDLQTFATKEPAFMEAYGYLQSQRHQELEALGVANPAQREQIIRQEARELIEGALKEQTSAAERIWKLAQARGYRPKAKDAATPPIDPKAAEQIERINRGKEASATLRGTGTTADTGTPLTLVKIAEMSENEYFATKAAYVSKHGKQAWDRLTSGR